MNFGECQHITLQPGVNIITTPWKIRECFSPLRVQSMVLIAEFPFIKKFLA